MMGFRAMNEESVYQADAEDIPSEVSDEALETAAGNEAWCRPECGWNLVAGSPVT